LRKRLSEESLLLGVLVAVGTAALATALTGGLFGATLLSLGVSTGAGAGKLAFDSLVQRDAPDANHGRSFARFEARFQIAWVLGAILPAVVPIGVTVGGTIVAIAVASALVSYLLGRTGRKLPRVPLRLPGRGRRPTTADLGPADAPDTGAGDDELTDDELRPSQPAAPARTSELAALAPDDPTVALAAPGSSDPPASRTEPAAPPWWADPSTPVVSSVEGVEVDERSWPAPTDDQVRDDADG
ncbi:MAG: hypothetical protein ACE5GB_11725, partial [Acidimicrobiales bacterium]